MHNAGKICPAKAKSAAVKAHGTFNAGLVLLF